LGQLLVCALASDFASVRIERLDEVVKHTERSGDSKHRVKCGSLARLQPQNGRPGNVGPLGDLDRRQTAQPAPGAEIFANVCQRATHW
jgi:hypothetical protein